MLSPLTPRPLSATLAVAARARGRSSFHPAGASGHAVELRRANRLGVLAALVVLLGLFSAQSAWASTLTGQVTAGGSPLAGAFVAATGPSGQAAAVSDAGGTFSLSLPDGTYQLTANAPGYKVSAADTTVSGASTDNLNLTASGAKMQSVPVFGGGTSVAADGTPGVFYIAGQGPGKLYRSVDWGGTWTSVTSSLDDASGLSDAGSADLLTTSGFPGELAVSMSTAPSLFLPTGVFYSTDYGVTWHLVGNSPTVCCHGSGMRILWGHAGARSVLMIVQSSPYAVYVADMTAANPSFVQMSVPYAASGQPIAVADGADQPWLATVDSSGTLSVSALIAQAAAPAPTVTLSGFPANPVAVGLGGQSAAGVPPAGALVASANAASMTVKAAGDAAYPAPATAVAAPCGGGVGLLSGMVTPNTAGGYGAGVVGGCWVQDIGGTVTVGGGGVLAIDAGYNATNSSAGTDAVVMGIGGRGINAWAQPVVATVCGTDGTGPG
jgi:hypothetical protein